MFLLPGVVVSAVRHDGMSMMSPMTPRIWARTTEPTLPRTRSTRPIETALMCWHCAEETRSRPLVVAASTTTSDPKSRIEEVKGTIWTTLGPASRIR